MAGPYVFFECCGSCLLFLFLRTSSLLFCPFVGFNPILPFVLRASSLLFCSLICFSKQLLKPRKF
jgi:hypothetical protein